MRNAGVATQILWSRSACQRKFFTCPCILRLPTSASESSSEQVNSRYVPWFILRGRSLKALKAQILKDIHVNPTYEHQLTGEEQESSSDPMQAFDHPSFSRYGSDDEQRDLVVRPAIENQENYNKRWKKNGIKSSETFEKGDIIGVAIGKDDRTKLDCSVLWGITAAKKNRSGARGSTGFKPQSFS